jgi:taurine dioxygenase
VQPNGRRAVIRVEPAAGALGAEIAGVDLARLGEAEFAAIRDAFHRHGVVFFRDQRLTTAEHKAFSARFGPLAIMPYVKPLDGEPEIIAVLKEAEEQRISVFGGAWHSDFSYLEEPPLGSVLYALKVPPCGGDTLWADMYAAYETLSPGLQHMLSGIRAMHSGHVYGAKNPPTRTIHTSRSIEITRGNAEADLERAQPVVRVHPATERKALFVNPIYTTRFEGMTEAESRPLLDFLYAHATRPEFTCRFRWTKGAVALWDNRCTLHYAINDYDGHRRLLHRTTIKGERPIGVDEIGSRHQGEPMASSSQAGPR